MDKLNKKSKMYLDFLKIFITLIAVFIMATLFGNSTSKYWFDFFIFNLVIIAIFLGALFFIITMIRNPKMASIKTVIITLCIVIISPLFFVWLALPLDKDFPVMMTKSYSEANGLVTKVDTGHSSKHSRDTSITIKDRASNKEITIKFSNQTSSNIKKGDNIKIKYLPNSLRGMSYTK